MKVWTCKDFTGHYPVGAGAVVLAFTSEEAAEILNNHLRFKHSLKGDAEAVNMIEFPHPGEKVRVLSDGNY